MIYTISDMTRDIIALSMVDGLGPVRVRTLIERIGSTEKIFSSKAPVITEILKTRDFDREGLKNIRSSAAFRSEIDYIQDRGIIPINFYDDKYPELLKMIYDPPMVIYCKGDTRALSGHNLAVVGSRRCTPYGMRTARRLSGEIAGKDINIVSGMAKGIDTMAHRGCIEHSGTTIGVMGSGFEHIYPSGSKKLAEEIIDSGGIIITEFTSRTLPQRTNFPRRNRIISGMSLGVLVVEAYKKSGAMITVNLALDEGRDVFAVPGPIDSPQSYGTNFLIQKGAKLVASADDLIDELGIPDVKKHKEKYKYVGSGSSEYPAAELIDMFENEESIHIDDILSSMGNDPGRISGMLLSLEIEGVIKRIPGGSYKMSRTSPGKVKV